MQTYLVHYVAGTQHGRAFMTSVFVNRDVILQWERELDRDNPMESDHVILSFQQLKS